MMWEPYLNAWKILEITTITRFENDFLRPDIAAVFKHVLPHAWISNGPTYSVYKRILIYACKRHKLISENKEVGTRTEHVRL
jgi:hypothetical protein